MDHKAFLKKELEATKLFDFRDSYGVPLWIYIRFNVFWELIMKEYNLVNPHVKEKLSLWEVIKYIFFTLLYNLFFARKKKINIIDSGGNNVKEGKKFINRLYDLYLESNKDLFLLESSFKFKYYRPRKNVKYMYADLLSILPAILRRFILVSRKDKTIINNFTNYLHNIGFIEHTDLYVRMLKNIVSANPVRIFIFNFYINLKKPLAFIIECAHYGSFAAIIKLLKDKGIKVMEMQHGYFDEAHIAYNYNRELIDKFKPYYPDYLLTFGEYWFRNICTPSQCIPIGNAYLEKKSSNMRIEKEKKIILIISGGNKPELYNELAMTLYCTFGKEFNIIFRPHPSERPEIKKRYSNIRELNISIDTSNLYQTLSEIEVIVSYEVSTVLFEALLYTNKIYLIRNKINEMYLNENIPFIISKDENDLIKSIKKNEFIDLSKIEIIWKPNAVENFNRFINQVLK